MWTARKVNPRTEGRLFKVDVEYLKDGVLDHTERYETSQGQPDNWPADAVKRHIQSLNELVELPAKITGGDVTLPADPVIDAAAEAWHADYSLASRAKVLVDLGVINADNVKYVALLARLKANFKAEYIGLV